LLQLTLKFEQHVARRAGGMCRQSAPEQEHRQEQKTSSGKSSNGAPRLMLGPWNV